MLVWPNSDVESWEFPCFTSLPMFEEQKIDVEGKQLITIMS